MQLLKIIRHFPTLSLLQLFFRTSHALVCIRRRKGAATEEIVKI